PGSGPAGPRSPPGRPPRPAARPAPRCRWRKIVPAADRAGPASSPAGPRPSGRSATCGKSWSRAPACSVRACAADTAGGNSPARPVFYLAWPFPSPVALRPYVLDTALLNTRRGQKSSAEATKKGPPARKLAALLRSLVYPPNLAVLGEVLDGADHLRGVAVLVVVPGHDLHLIGVVVDLGDHGLGSVEQRAVAHADDVGGNDLVLVVAEGLRSGSLHGGVDGLLGHVLALDDGHQDGGGAGGD